ncbi:hypothetical protein [Gordoniibacillus kamchatkensis]|uniref:hypothetical protein n=1 Tax=Gordoniibacillus kamchatkensis TaxID=1590651 RepID=UPI0012E04314|nr:hypothetical protein [Paenibacillus sp. VKM B-2647]
MKQTILNSLPHEVGFTAKFNWTPGKMVLILDNARIDHAKILEPFAKELNGRLQLVFQRG